MLNSLQWQSKPDQGKILSVVCKLTIVITVILTRTVNIYQGEFQVLTKKLTKTTVRSACGQKMMLTLL